MRIKRFYREYKTYHTIQYAFFTLKNIFHNIDNFRYLKLPIINNVEDGVVVVTHEANKRGASILAGHIAKEIVNQGRSAIILSRQFGDLSDAYNDCTEYVIAIGKVRCRIVLKSLFFSGYNTIVLNTVVNGDLVRMAKKIGFRVICLVHETLPAIKDLGAERAMGEIIQYCDKLVYPTNILKQEMVQRYGNNNNTIICPQGLYLNKSGDQHITPKSRARVIAVGDVSYRKGFDIFVQLANYVNNVDFYWVGNGRDNSFYYETLNMFKQSFPDNFHFIKDMLSKDLFDFYFTADVFVLSSRYDTFPSVMLEAMNAGVPVVGYRDSGGIIELVKDQQNGLLVDNNEDVPALANAIRYFLSLSVKERNDVALRCKETAEAYSFDKYVRTILSNE